MTYEETAKALRLCGLDADFELGESPCEKCPRLPMCNEDHNMHGLFDDAARTIDELLKVAKAMHTWIFLNSADEQKAYEECGLTDEINFALGYGGKVEIVTEPEKTENATTTYDLLYEEGGLGIR